MKDIGTSADQLGRNMKTIDLGAGLAATAVAAGWEHTCALRNGGSLVCWGANDVGQLGVGGTADVGSSPGQMGSSLLAVNLGAGRAPVAVVAGFFHTCALLSGGAVACWGYNKYGQLGIEGTDNVGTSADQMGGALRAVDLGPGRTASVVDAGGYHTCVLLDGGDVACWGRNDMGQLGIGNTISVGTVSGQMGSALRATDLGSGRAITTLALGESHSCALLVDGGVVCWGKNDDGQLGAGNTEQVGTGPGQMGFNLSTVNLGPGNSVSSLAAGSAHTCAVLQDGGVVCWGWNSGGQLGIGSIYDVGIGPGEMGSNLKEVSFGPGLPVISVSGKYHSCALVLVGDVVCWGDNTYGQLGIGSTATVGTAAIQDDNLLQRVDLGSGVTAVSISVGIYHTCALRKDGQVVCWGRNQYGQLGIGNTSNVGTTPQDMGANLHIADLGSGVTASTVAAGEEHTCALRTDAAVVCWGRNDVGQLGNGNTENVGNFPGQMGSKLRPVDLGTVGGFHTCVMRNDKSIVCWGYNSNGQLGIGNKYNVGYSLSQMGAYLKAVDLGPGRSANAIFLGYGHSCALRDDASLVCWGLNNFGQLGVGNTVDVGTTSGDMGINLLAVNVGTGLSALSISAGIGHTCAVRSDMSLVCWGHNSWGELGIGSQDSVGVSANQLGDMLRSVNIGPGRSTLAVFAAMQHTCALRSDRTVVCWGDNTEGKLGIGNTCLVGTDAASLGENIKPVGLVPGSKASAIVAGGRHACALLVEGSVVCWGLNIYGQLGTGRSGGFPGDRSVEYPQAVDLGPGLRAVAITAGDYHTCAIRTDAAVVCWGWNLYGQLGIGSTVNIGTTPSQMGSNLSMVDLGAGYSAQHINAGYRFTCALRNDWNIVCWGRNNYGQLGVGNTHDVGTLPMHMGANLKTVNLGTGAMAKYIGCGLEFACALRNDERVVCWGRNQFGQVGVGSTDTVLLAEGSEPLSVGLGPDQASIALSVGGFHACVLLRNSSVACWGFNLYGQLGIGSIDAFGSVTTSDGTNFLTVNIGKGREISSVVCGEIHTCVLLKDSSVICWGRASQGQLATGSIADVGVTTQQMGGNLRPALLGTVGGVVTAISAAGVFTCALRSNGTVTCWGSNDFGQLGLRLRVRIGIVPDDMGSNLLAINFGPGWCPDGSSFQGSNQCSCNVGSYERGTRGEGACVLCTAGTFASSSGLSSCKACAAGTFSSQTGSTSKASCIFCWPGSYSSQQASNTSLTCQSCAPGTFSNTSGASAPIQCNSCPPGSFSYVAGPPQSRDVGRQQIRAVNSTVCSGCPAGTFASSPGQSACTTCASGTRSVIGSFSCFSDSSSGPNVGVIIGSVVGAVSVLVAVCLVANCFLSKWRAKVELELGESKPMYGMRSISVKGLEELIEKLRALPFFAGKDVDHISSNDVRKYILDGHDHPALLFPECFSEQEPVAAITYEWKLTFGDVLSYLNAQQVAACSARWGGKMPLDMSQLLVWIDVFFIDQLSTNIAANLQEAMRVYSTAPFHLMLVTGSIFSRSWCLYEFAVRRHREKETLVLESLRVQSCQGQSSRCRFFDDMQATKEEDKLLIREKIELAFGSGKRFDMEMLSLYILAGGVRND